MASLHHVREGAADPLAWDLGFLAFGAALVLVGVALARRGLARSAAAGERARRAA